MPYRPINYKPPDKSLQQAAFETLSYNRTETQIKKLLPEPNPIVYTRGTYKPQPVYWRGSKSSSSLHDESRISRKSFPPNDELSPSGTDDDKGGRSTDSTLEKPKEVSPENTSFSETGPPPGMPGSSDTPKNSAFAPAKGYSPFLYNSLSRKVTVLRPLQIHSRHTMHTFPVRGSRFDKRIEPPQIVEPGPVDFSKYNVLAQLWMEQVDSKTVLKSKTMYLTVLPRGTQPPDMLTSSMKYQPLSNDGSQWIIARGRSMRRMKRQLDGEHKRQSQMLNASADECEVDGRPISPGKQSMLFFKIGDKWPDLAWVLFDGLLSESETIRLVTDIQLKNPGDLTGQMHDLMNRWWKMKGRAATIEQLQDALDLVEVPYIQGAGMDSNASFFDTDKDKEFKVQKSSMADPDVSRLMQEYTHNTSFVADNPNRLSVLSAQPKGSSTGSLQALARDRSKFGSTASRDNSFVKSVSRDSSLVRLHSSKNDSFRMFSSQDSLNIGESYENKRRSTSKEQLKPKKVSRVI